MLTLAPVVTAAQVVRVSGRVVEDARGAPIAGATVRVTGSSDQTTDSLGRFEFKEVLPGRLVLTVMAVGYQFRSMPLGITIDTAITVEMRAQVVALDPMVVRPGRVRIRGTIVDSMTGDEILFPQVYLYPANRNVRGNIVGGFKFEKVVAGPVTIVVEASEHLPRVIELDAVRDTNLTIRLGADSVALKMISTQVRRIEGRSNGTAYTVRGYNGDVIAGQAGAVLGEFVDRSLLRSHNPARRAALSADDACVFYDDRKIPPAMLDALLPELIARVEIYHRGAMIRVYSKRYAMSLVAEEQLRPVIYIPTGLRRVCE